MNQRMGQSQDRPPLVALDLTPDSSRATFVTEHLVRFCYCDPAGIVFFPRYFELLNGAVEDWWIHIGKPWSELVSERKIGTPTVQLNSQFLAPSFFGEPIKICVQVEKIGSSSLDLVHRIVGAKGDERARINQRLVATSLDTHRSIPWPDDIRQAIHSFTEKND